MDDKCPVCGNNPSEREKELQEALDKSFADRINDLDDMEKRITKLQVERLKDGVRLAFKIKQLEAEKDILQKSEVCGEIEMNAIKAERDKFKQAIEDAINYQPKGYAKGLNPFAIVGVKKILQKALKGKP